MNKSSMYLRILFIMLFIFVSFWLLDLNTQAHQPTVSNVRIIEPNYCISGPAATVEWDYFDPDDHPQASFHVQIDAEGSSFKNPPVDCKCSAGAWSGSSCVYSGSCDGSLKTFYSGAGILLFNKTYKARVRASASAVLVSDFLKHDFASVDESLLANILKSLGNLFR
ncbi:MAG: hypothetical protein HYW77_02405 [Parcubacteria group bacterium]|nr:hypothetical protein [Parcubacteria group bacterium]